MGDYDGVHGHLSLGGGAHGSHGSETHGSGTHGTHGDACQAWVLVKLD